MSMRKRRDLLQPFKVALGGVVHTFRTQRHLRIHIFVVLAVVLLGILFDFRARELMVLLFTITLVLVAEMFNSAIEATVDLVQPEYHPLAKFAKDISAGAVLITTVLALVIGTLILLGDNRWEEIKVSLTTESLGLPPLQRIVFGIFIVFLVVVIGKGLGKRGKVLQGGLVSGHAALGFFLAGAIMFITDQQVVTAIAILLAAIIAQSRWEAKIHTIFELTLGAAVGVVLALVLFGGVLAK
jgi:diacylglycerol kinase (ATP)